MSSIRITTMLRISSPHLLEVFVEPCQRELACLVARFAVDVVVPGVWDGHQLLLRAGEAVVRSNDGATVEQLFSSGQNDLDRAVRRPIQGVRRRIPKKMLRDRRASKTRDDHETGLGVAELAPRPPGPFLIAEPVESAEPERRHLDVQRLDAMIIGSDIRGNTAPKTGPPETNAGRVAARLGLHPVDHVRQILDLGQRIENLAQFDDLGGEAMARPFRWHGARENHARVAVTPAAIVEEDDEIAGAGER